jgi:RNA polymerase sigma factor (sigma-70 family)
MAHVISSSVVRQIGSLFDGGSVSGLSDRQLLDRFVSPRDDIGEAAFGALVARHGPMVLHVCRQVVGDFQHAEDTFQAVFLVLARRAHSVRDPDLLSNWLYGVALRTARKAKVRLARQRKNERDNAIHGASPGFSADRSVIEREQAEMLHDEIERLPRDFRRPIVLCYFEGLTLDQAARRLRWREGTLRSRLARARDKLRRSLTRRGVVLPAATLAAVLNSKPASASIPSPLCDNTTRAAIHFASGRAAAGAISVSAAGIAREVLRSMLVNRMKLAVSAFLFFGAVAAGAGYLTQLLAMQNEASAPQPQAATKPDQAAPRPAPGRMFVVGRVLDPQGKPVPNATVMASARSKTIGASIGLEALSSEPIGQASSDGSGRFRVDTPRISSSSYDQFSAIAVAPGYGVGCAELDPDVTEPFAEIRLRPEQVIRGRLFDIAGQPAQGVKVSVWSIRRPLHRVVLDPARERSDGPSYRWARANDMPAWPKPATTDAEGRFTLHGVGRGLQVSLAVIDPRFAMQMIDWNNDAGPGAMPLTMALQPARIINGRVSYADTGKPVHHALIIVWTPEGTAPHPINLETDADGRFRVNPTPGDRLSIMAAPPDGQPYLSAYAPFSWSKGTVESSLKLALPRGVLIRGKVTQEGSGKPVAGATVMFVRAGASLASRSNGLSRPAETRPDGSFQLAVVPQPGHLAIQAPSDQYVLREMGYDLFFQGRGGGPRLYSHAFIACDPKPASSGLEIGVALRPGVTLHGRVVGPDGQAVEDAWMISRCILKPGTVPWRRWRADEHGTARDGRFELHGLDPDAEVLVYFLDPQRKLGTTARFAGQSVANGPVTVRLEPCVTAKARLVGADGKPLGDFAQPWLISMVVTPDAIADPIGRDERPLMGDVDFLTRLDTINYRGNPAADAQGRIAFPALIPGATYRIVNRGPRGARGPRVNKDFTVRPGETLDLGDIPIEKPQK